MTKLVKSIAGWFAFAVFSFVSHLAAESFATFGTWKHFAAWLTIFFAVGIGAVMFYVANEDEEDGK